LTESAIDRLAELSWPGNIRELRNVLSRLTLSECGSLIDRESVDAVLDQSHCAQSVGRSLDTAVAAPLKANLHQLQRAQVLSAFAETGKNISKTARRLGVSRNTIYRTLRDRQT
jgi:transcriptional regulator of acetoin/glycerol metabolism